MIFAVFIHQIFQAEGLSYVISMVRVAVNLLQECHHKEEFLILLLPHVSFYRDAIIHLVGKRYDRVVNYYYIFQITISYDSQIFNVYPMDRVDAMLSVKSMLDDLPVWINKVQGCISIILCTSCKYADLVILCKEIQSHI